MKFFPNLKSAKQAIRVSTNSFLIPSKYSFQLVQKSTTLPVAKSVVEKKKAVAKSETSKKTKKKEVIVASKIAKTEPVIAEKVNVDQNKRLFMRLASVAGLGVLAATVLPKKAEAYVMGSSPTSAVVGMKDSTNVRVNPAKEDGNLLSVKTNTDPLVASGAGGYVRQDSTGTIAKETGGNLATIAGKDFATEATLAQIKAQTDKFTFSGSNLLTAGGSAASVVGLNNSKSVQIDPATDDSVLLLRRIVKLMESQATVDSANRQRITLDSLGTGTAITTTVPVSGTVTSTVTGATVTTVSTVSAITTFLGQNQQAFQDVARLAFAEGSRKNLTFS